MRHLAQVSILASLVLVGEDGTDAFALVAEPP